MQELASAIKIACNGHDGQFDKGGMPYILHPMKVMHYTKSTDVKVLAAAVLHDVIEDTSYTYQDLREAGISEEVIEAVRALTKQPGQTFEEYKHAVLSNKIARTVKKADLRHNSDLRRIKGVTDKDVARTAKYMRFYQEIKEFELALESEKE